MRGVEGERRKILSTSRRKKSNKPKKTHRERVGVSRGDERLCVEHGAVRSRVDIGLVDDLRNGKERGVRFVSDGERRRKEQKRKRRRGRSRGAAMSGDQEIRKEKVHNLGGRASVTLLSAMP